MQKNIDSCVILCGGKSSRLKSGGGKSKIFLPFGDKSLVAHNFHKMRGLFSRVFISCKESHKDSILQSLNDAFDAVDESVVLVENSEIFAPMVGIVNAFERVEREKIFVLSCDCPLIKAKTIDILRNNARDYDVVFAKDSTRTHPLIGVWSAKVCAALKGAIDAGNFKIMDLLGTIPTKSIFFDKAEFLNINTKADYKTALKMLES